MLHQAGQSVQQCWRFLYSRVKSLLVKCNIFFMTCKSYDVRAISLNFLLTCDDLRKVKHRSTLISLLHQNYIFLKCKITMHMRIKYFCQIYVIFKYCIIPSIYDSLLETNKKYDLEIRNTKSPFTVQSEEDDLRDMHTCISRTNVYLVAAMLK